MYPAYKVVAENKEAIKEAVVSWGKTFCGKSARPALAVELLDKGVNLETLFAESGMWGWFEGTEQYGKTYTLNNSLLRKVTGALGLFSIERMLKKIAVVIPVVSSEAVKIGGMTEWDIARFPFVLEKDVIAGLMVHSIDSVLFIRALCLNADSKTIEFYEREVAYRGHYVVWYDVQENSTAHPLLGLGSFKIEVEKE